ncbi:MAG: carbohydrate ABC transporter permease, partial [Anaeroplasmataceae bacterium]|nr:carbohydrate ABC transporter permease [Anaeroplasmataceae bacterium]
FKTVNEINSNEYHLFPKAFDFMKLVNLWNRLDFGRYYVNTILVVIGAMICSVLFNGLLAYAIGVLKPAGYKIINGLILFSYMIPAALSLFPLVMQIRDFGMINSYLPLCLIFGSNAYYFMLFKDYFQKIPSSLIEAARMDGLSDFRIFYKVVLPLSKPIIGVVAIFTMTAAYSDFLLPYLILQDDGMKTVMVAIYNLSSTTTIDTSEFLMLLVISIIPQIIIFIIFQKQIMGSQVSSGMKE